MSKYPQAGPARALSILVFFALVPYASVAGAPLLADERILFFEARKFIALDPLAPFQLPLGGSGTWRPMLSYVYWLDSGAPAFLSHGLNLAIHLTLVLLSWRWMSRLVEARAALMGAALFACHGAHVASAGWVAGRADLLMATCVVLSLLAQQRHRIVLCALAGGLAVLCKETGLVVVPMLALMAWRREEDSPIRWQIPLVTGAVVLPMFLLSTLRSEVATSYWPSVPSLGAGLVVLPSFAVELIAPLFRPIGLGHGWQDAAGLLLALPLLVSFVIVGWRSTSRATWLLGLGLSALALLPVLHVLPNDGGQWYLLLPSLGIGLSWSIVLSDRRVSGALAIGVIALFALYCSWESSRWAQASEQVDEIIRQAREVRSAAQAPANLPVQDPRDWPHMGPSLCCGIPFQVLEDLPPR